MENQLDVISASLVAESDRLDFIPNLFSANVFMVVNFEAAVYSFASTFISEYNGGFWDFWTLSNGSGFMALPENETYYAENNMNYSCGNFTGKEMGIIVTSFALSYLMAQYHNKPSLPIIIRRYNDLMNYIAELESNDHILEFLD